MELAGAVGRSGFRRGIRRDETMNDLADRRSRNTDTFAPSGNGPHRRWNANGLLMQVPPASSRKTRPGSAGDRCQALVGRSRDRIGEPEQPRLRFSGRCRQQCDHSSPSRITPRTSRRGGGGNRDADPPSHCRAIHSLSDGAIPRVASSGSASMRAAASANSQRRPRSAVRWLPDSNERKTCRVAQRRLRRHPANAVAPGAENRRHARPSRIGCGADRSGPRPRARPKPFASLVKLDARGDRSDVTSAIGQRGASRRISNASVLLPSALERAQVR